MVVKPPGNTGCPESVARDSLGAASRSTEVLDVQVLGTRSSITRGGQTGHKKKNKEEHKIPKCIGHLREV